MAVEQPRWKDRNISQRPYERRHQEHFKADGHFCFRSSALSRRKRPGHTQFDQYDQTGHQDA